VYATEASSGDLVMVACHGVTPEFETAVARFSADSEQKRMLASGRPIYASYEDVIKLDAVRRAQGFTTIGLIPVVAGGELAGALNVGSRSVRELPIGTREWLETVAALTSGALARVQAERVAAEDRRNLSALFDGVDDLILVLGADGTVLEVNRVVLQRLGLSRSALIGASAESVVDRRRDDRSLPELIAGVGDRQRATGAFLSADGARIAVEAHATRGEWGGRPVRYVICRDITEHVQTQRRLRTSEERFRTVAEYTYDWEYWLSADRQLFYTSPSCERITGYRTEELVADPHLLVKMAHTDDRAKVARHLREEAGAGPPCTLVYRVVGRDGAIRWVEHVCQEVRGTDGRFLGRRASIRDVTEQRRTEAALRESERLYRETLASISDAVLVVDPDGRFLVVSGNVGEVFGLSAEEVFAAGTIWELLGEETCDLQQVWDGSEVSRQTVTSSSGVVLEMSCARTPIHGGSILVTCRDVTAEHKAQASRVALEEAIQRAASEWQATFDTVAAMIVLVDDSGRVVRLNQAARISLDRSFTALVGAHISSLAGGVLWEAVQELYAAVTAGGEQLERIVSSDDGTTWWQVVGSATEVDDEVRVVIIAREITAVVELERSLQHSERMSAMGELVGAVAHEVRNPLFALSATVDAFVEQFQADASLAPFIAALQRQVERLSDLMGQLLEFGRRPETSLVSGDVRAVIREAVLLLQPALDTKEIEVVVDAPDELPEVPLNYERLLMLVRNLLDNACHFTPIGRCVQVRVWYEERSEQVGGDVVLAVRDEGSGFGDVDTGQVFDPFFSRRAGGTEEHGGAARAYDHDECGAVVEVRLPLRAQGEA
jgi:PAS domain S-box-containing protein